VKPQNGTLVLEDQGTALFHIFKEAFKLISREDTYLTFRHFFRYPFIACEVIACEVWGIFESALSNIDMLVKFWEFLDRPPPLNPVQASYFAKVIGVFLMKKTGDVSAWLFSRASVYVLDRNIGSLTCPLRLLQMLQFIKSQPEVVPKLLLHMSTSSIMDLLLKIISMEESVEGKGTVQVQNNWVEQGVS